MRSSLTLIVVLCFSVCACNSGAPDVSSNQSAISDPDPPPPQTGQVDPPIAGSEPLPDNHEGARISPRPPDPERTGKRAAFKAAATRQRSDWAREHLTREQIQQRHRALKNKMLPPHPPPPPDAGPRVSP